MAAIRKQDYSTEQVFLGRKNFIPRTFTNASGGTIVLVPGQLMGAVTTTGKVAICKSGSSDGSQSPRFLCADNYSIPDGETATIYVANSGDVNQNAVTFDGTDTWTTVVSTLGTMYDLLTQNAANMILYPVTELSNYDN
jgi:hypothetical protein